jgi:hypothetical protein
MAHDYIFNLASPCHGKPIPFLWESPTEDEEEKQIGEFR